MYLKEFRSCVTPCVGKLSEIQYPAYIHTVRQKQFFFPQTKIGEAIALLLVCIWRLVHHFRLNDI